MVDVETSVKVMPPDSELLRHPVVQSLAVVQKLQQQYQQLRPQRKQTQQQLQHQPQFQHQLLLCPPLLRHLYFIQFEAQRSVLMFVVPFSRMEHLFKCVHPL